MIKVRDPIAAQVDKLARQANTSGTMASLLATYDPRETHQHTSVTIRLNQFEAELFRAAADKADRKVVDWMRRNLVRIAEEQLSNL